MAGESLLDWPLSRLHFGEGAELPRLAHALERLHVPWSELQKYVRFDPTRYARNLIYRDRTHELLLLCWLPGQATAVHDHPGSCGVVRPLVGTLEEVVYDALATRRPIGRRALALDRVAVELPATVHQVANAGSRPALSLHLYSPPLTT